MSISRPSKIVCVGRSYAEHAAELGNAIPEQALLFIKPPSSLATLQQGVSWDKTLGSCHYECELALRIGQPLSKETNPETALAAIDAITLGLDLTLRDVQSQLKAKGQPWERAKAFDGACILADWVNINEVEHWQNIHFNFFIDGELKQRGDTALMLFPIANLIMEISQCFSLEVGDVIMTGTPAGVGQLHAGQQLHLQLLGKTQTFNWQTIVNN